MKIIREYIRNRFEPKYSFAWAVRQMMKGKIITKKNCLIGALKLRIEPPSQQGFEYVSTIQEAFFNTPENYKKHYWRTALFFPALILTQQWEVFDYAKWMQRWEKHRAKSAPKELEEALDTSDNSASLPLKRTGE